MSETQEPAPPPRTGATAEDAAAAWRALRDGLGAAAAVSGHDGEMRCVELCPICRAADILRASGPPELRGQINEFQREALVTLRTLLDHYIGRLDGPPPAGGAVEDIPIE
ncbi:MAG: hypothetical protein WBB30_03010 [Solirubrobacterales bacterium]